MLPYNGEGYRPRYDINASELYTIVATWALQSPDIKDPLLILSNAYHNSASLSDPPSSPLPSWVPDWSQTSVPELLWHGNYSAGGNSKPSFQLLPNNRLQISGTRVDTILETLYPYDETKSHYPVPLEQFYPPSPARNKFTLTQFWLQQCIDLFVRRTRGDAEVQPEEFETFFRTLTCDRPVDPVDLWQNREPGPRQDPNFEMKWEAFYDYYFGEFKGIVICCSPAY
jgi:hypothetical protein